MHHERYVSGHYTVRTIVGWGIDMIFGPFIPSQRLNTHPTLLFVISSLYRSTTLCDV